MISIIQFQLYYSVYLLLKKTIFNLYCFFFNNIYYYVYINKNNFKIIYVENINR